MPDQSVNTFTELNTDSHPINTKPNVMIDAINATLTTKGQNQLILQNMTGNEAISGLTPGFQPVGVKVYKDIAYILSAEFDTNGNFINGEIGTFPSPDWGALTANGIDSEFYLPLKQEYSPLKNFSTLPDTPINNSALANDLNYNEPFRTSLLNFRSDRLIEIEIQPSYDDSVNIVFTDDNEPIRLVNSRFKVGEDGKTAAIADRRQNKDTNTYAESRFGATKLLKQSDKIIDLTYNGISFGGSLQGGGYRFYFKYIDSDGSLTDIVEESRLVSIAYDNHGATPEEATGRSVSFTLDNLDQKFSGVKVYYSYASGETDVTTVIKEITNLYDVPSSGPMTVVIYGTEDVTDISYASLNLDYSSIDTVKTIAQYDDRLALANITNATLNFEDLRLSAQKLQIEEDVIDLDIKELGTGYADSSNIYYKLGVWAGETYEISIVFVLKNGRGITPAFPIRGIDNYNGTASYTGTTPILDADGFISGTSENRLGVYRTHSDRVMLKGSNQEKTEVKYLKVNIQEMYNDPIVQAETSGFFFVRRERRKDAISQGYFTNTCQIPIESINTQLNANSGGGNASLVNIQDARLGIGIDPFGSGQFGSQGKSLKILPSPGRIWENVITSSNGNASSGQASFSIGDPLSIQGKVFPDPQKTDDGNGNYYDMYYAYFSPDQLVNPQLYSSIFNGSKKGVRLNGENPIVGHQYQIPHTVLNTGGTGLPSAPYTYQCNYDNQAIVLHTSDATQAGAADATWSFDNAFTMIEQTAGGNIVFQTQATFISKANGGAYNNSLRIDDIHYDFNGNPVQTIADVFIEVDGTGNIVSSGSYVLIADIVGTTYQGVKVGVIGPGPGNNNFYQRPESSISGTFDHPQQGTIGAPGNPVLGNFNLTMTLPVYSENSIGVTPGVFNPFNQPDYTETVNVSGQYIVNNFTPTIQNLVQLSATSKKPIQDIWIENFNFKPTDSQDVQNRDIYTTFITNNQESYSGNQFASKSNSNIFYVLRSPLQGDNKDLPWQSGPVIGSGQSTIFAKDQIEFSDYIGIRMTRFDQLLTDPLKNDDLSVFNYQNHLSNGYGLVGDDLGDWTYKTDDLGFRFAVLGNIYDDPNGVMSQADWKNKYANTSFSEPYFAISKRYKWEDFLSLPITSRVVDLFDGDCYINYTYKRLNYALGIEGVPTATDPTLYSTANREAGLYDRGTVFPLICESNYNHALRTFEFKDAVEKVLFGKNRTFFPIDTIEDIRKTRQPESRGYNFGYNYAFSDRNYIALNDRAPVLNVNNGNRIQVSESSIIGNFQNGYTDFSGLNFRDYNKQLGEITKLVSHNNSLFCIFEKGIGVVPMNEKTMLPQGTGDGIVIDNAQILGQKMNIISTEYGSTQQFSIMATDEYVYGCDFNKNKIWRIVNEGPSNRLELISDFAIQVILNEYKDRLSSNQLKNLVKVNYDRNRNNVIFSFLNNIDGKYTTDLYEFVYTEPGPIDADPIFDDPIGSGGDDPVDPIFDDPAELGGELEAGDLTDENLSENNAVNYQAKIAEEKQEKVEEFGTVDNSIIEETTNEQVDLPVVDPDRAEDPILNPDGNFQTPTRNQFTGTYEPVLWKENQLGSVYYNETLSKWVSRLSWNPLFMPNLGSKLYSFNAKDDMETIWEHFSENVPFCNFYGKQDKFMFEFVIVDNASAQKILNNLLVVCNRSFPGRVLYTLDKDYDFETFAVKDNSYTELMKQRHEYVNWTMNQSLQANNELFVDFGISSEEAERVEGSNLVFNNNIYILGPQIIINDVVYVKILDDNGIPIVGNITGFTFNKIEFGIFKQNMEYNEDHLYIEIGKDDPDKSKIRDKAIKVKFIYEGKEYVTVQSIISLFIYSYT